MHSQAPLISTPGQEIAECENKHNTKPKETGADEMTSALFWDGKKYRYIPIGASME